MCNYEQLWISQDVDDVHDDDDDHDGDDDDDDDDDDGNDDDDGLVCFPAALLKPLNTFTCFAHTLHWCVDRFARHLDVSPSDKLSLGAQRQAP